MLKLPDVTLITISSVKLPETLQAFERCKRMAKFADHKFFTHDTGISPDAVKIPMIVDIGGYNKFCLHKIAEHLETPYCLVIQYDGFILDPRVWTDEFLEYDWVGAAWWHGDMNCPVGNGGFSLRSKKIQDITATDPTFANRSNTPEDHLVCRTYRSYLEKEYDIKFAPREVADKFSFEPRPPTQPTFGFHGAGWLNLLERAN